MARRRGQKHAAIDAGRELDRPFQSLHPTHGAARDAEELVDPQPRHQHGLGSGHVGYGDDRKIEAIDLAGFGIDRGGTRGAHAAAQDIRGDDEIAVGVERLARPDHMRPPGGTSRDGIGRGDELVAGQGVTQKDGVGAIRIERAIGGVANLHPFKTLAGIQPQGRAKTHDGAAGNRITGRDRDRGRMEGHGKS